MSAVSAPVTGVRERARRVASLAPPTSFGAVLGAPPPGSLALTSGSPDVALLPGAELAEAVARVVADPARSAVALDYSARPGHPGLRAWAAAREGVDAERVLVTNGALHGIALTVLAAVDPGDVVVVENPVYPLVLSVLQLTGARVESVPTDADGLDVDALADRLRAGLRPRLVYVVPDFHNPTGASLHPQRRVRLVELAERYGFVVISDNPYSPLRWADETPDDLDAGSDRVVRVNTFSKVLGPGLRLGWAVVPDWLRPGLVDLRGRLDQHASGLVQEAVADLVTEPAWYDGVAAAASAEYERRSHALLDPIREGLGEAVTVRAPAGGLFLWLRPSVDATALATELGNRGILVNPGEQFVPPGADEGAATAVRSHLRLTYARHGTDVLREAAQRFVAAHHHLTPEHR